MSDTQVVLHLVFSYHITFKHIYFIKLTCKTEMETTQAKQRIEHCKVVVWEWVMIVVLSKHI